MFGMLQLVEFNYYHNPRFLFYVIALRYTARLCIISLTFVLLHIHYAHLVSRRPKAEIPLVRNTNRTTTANDE